MVLAASPDIAMRRAREDPPEDLNGVDFIGFDEELPIRREVDRFLKRARYRSDQTLHFDNLQMIKEAVAHHARVSIMPARIMREEWRKVGWWQSISKGRTCTVRWGSSIARKSASIKSRRNSSTDRAKRRGRSWDWSKFPDQSRGIDSRRHEPQELPRPNGQLQVWQLPARTGRRERGIHEDP